MPTHLDSHQYTHLIRPIFNIVIKLAKKYNIKWIRYPKQNKYTLVKPINNLIKKICLTFLLNYQLKMLQQNNIYYPDFSYGIMTNGHLNEYILREFLEDLQSGLTDITCHPGYKPINKKYEAWKYKREEEENALESKYIKDLITKLNIRLVNYAK